MPTQAKQTTRTASPTRRPSRPGDDRHSRPKRLMQVLTHQTTHLYNIFPSSRLRDSDHVQRKEYVSEVWQREGRFNSRTMDAKHMKSQERRVVQVYNWRTPDAPKQRERRSPRRRGSRGPSCRHASSAAQCKHPASQLSDTNSKVCSSQIQLDCCAM